MTPAQAAMLAYLQKAYGGEAVFRPSNVDRWGACPGSVQLIARLPRGPRTSSPAARQGTGAHQLGQTVLENTQGITTEDFIGRHIVINDDPTDLIFVDEEMANKIGDYVDLVDGYRHIPNTEVRIEHKLSLGALDPANPLLHECRGTSDAVAINRTDRWIAIVDLKYGVKPVPGDSDQPKLYLLMAFLCFGDGKPWAWGNTTIYQPRLPTPPNTEDDYYKPFYYNPPDAIFGPFLDKVVGAMYAALAPDPPLNPSPKACFWCEAGRNDICPALRTAAFSMADTQPRTTTQSLMSRMGPVRDVLFAQPGEPPKPPADTGPIVLRSPEDYTPEDMSRLLKGGEMFKLWFKGMQHRASQLIQAGVDIPGWYMKSRTGNRRWKLSPKETEQALFELKMGPDQQPVLGAADIYTEPKMRSPKQIEDRLPTLLKGAIADFVERPLGEPTLVYGTDPDKKQTLPARLGPIKL